MPERPVIRVMPPRPVTANTPEERVALQHLRGDCHDGTVCPICKAWVNGRTFGAREAVREIAEGR